MKKEIPNSAVYAAIAVALVLVVAAGFMLLRDSTPTKAVNMVGRDKLKGPPAPTMPPAWALEKFRQHS